MTKIDQIFAKFSPNFHRKMTEFFTKFLLIFSLNFIGFLSVDMSVCFAFSCSHFCFVFFLLRQSKKTQIGKRIIFTKKFYEKMLKKLCFPRNFTYICMLKCL